MVAFLAVLHIYSRISRNICPNQGSLIWSFRRILPARGINPVLRQEFNPREDETNPGPRAASGVSESAESDTLFFPKVKKVEKVHRF